MSSPTRYVDLIFDRGTLLVPWLPEGVASYAPELVWDARVGAYRAPAWCAERIRERLVARGVCSRLRVRKRGGPPSPFGEVLLRPYQQSALQAWRAARGRGLVVLPTGAGKTRLAMAAMALTRWRSLCLVPTRALLHQWARELARFYQGPVGLLGDGVRAVEALTIATYESAYRMMGSIGDRFDLLVIDEAHHFGSGARDEALKMSIARARLGLTATPVRDPEHAARIAALIGPTVMDVGVAELAGTYLASLEVHVIAVDFTPEERLAYERDMASFTAVRGEIARTAPNLPWEEFVRAACATPEGREALAAWRRARKLLGLPAEKSARLDELLEHHRGARILVFTPDNEVAYAVARRHLIMPITCDIRRRERDAALERFRSGELNVLVSAQVLNEGIDVPDAQVGVIVGGSGGQREHVQRVGRVLRPAPGKRAIVYELVTRDTTEMRQGARRREALGSASFARA